MFGVYLFIYNGRANVNTVQNNSSEAIVTELNIGPNHHKPHNINKIVILKWLFSSTQQRRKSTLLLLFSCPSNTLSRDL